MLSFLWLSEFGRRHKHDIKMQSRWTVSSATDRSASSAHQIGGWLGPASTNMGNAQTGLAEFAH